jgi:hypothetical protein
MLFVYMWKYNDFMEIYETTISATSSNHAELLALMR